LEACAAEATLAAVSGRDRIESRDGRVWLDLSDAGQLVVLERLAEQAGFALDLREVTPRRLTLRLEGATLAEAVAAVVGETTYRLSYAFDPQTGAHRLVEVQVGEGDPTRAPREERVGAARIAPPRLATSPSAARAEAKVEADDAAARGESSRDRIERAREQAADLRESLRRASGEERHQRARDYEQAQEILEQRKRKYDPDYMLRQLNSLYKKHDLFRSSLLRLEDELPAVLWASADGALRVYRSGKNGRWTKLAKGLPGKDAYLSVLRQAMTSDDCTPGGVYFGTGAGQVFASADEGASWQLAAEYLPPIQSVTVAVVE